MPTDFRLIGPRRTKSDLAMWEADLTVEGETWFNQEEPAHQTRTIFLQEAPAQRQRSAAMLVRCHIRRLRVRLPDQALNLQATPEGRSGVVSLMIQNSDEAGITAYLLHGDIPLDLVWHQVEWQQQPPRIPGFDKIAFIRLTADGLSFAGDGQLPWHSKPVRARFLLRRPLAEKYEGAPPSAYRVDLDRRDPASERTITHEDALKPFVDAFRQLRTILSSPVSGKRPQWQELELSREAIPAFHWRILDKTPSLYLDPGTVTLRLTDGAPSESTEGQKPRRVSTLRPLWRIEGTPGALTLAVETSVPSAGARATWAWSAGTTDALTLDDVPTSDDALATALWVRQELGLPRPEPIDTDPPGPVPAKASEVPDLPDRAPRKPVLLAFAPVEDGWTHWPVPNLILEDYEPPPARVDAPSWQPELMSGAVAYEFRPEPDAPPPTPNPWSITILQGKALSSNSCWRFAFTETSSEVESAITCIVSPELVLDGLLWLSVHKPTVEDALPDLVDHLRHLRSIPLRSIDAADDTPSAFSIRWTDLKLELGADTGARAPGIARWKMSLEMSDLRVDGQPGSPRLFSVKARPWLKAFGHVPIEQPLLFRRHPTLPFIQSLPFLQTQDPPSHPAASRELGVFTQPWNATFGNDGWIAPDRRWEFLSSGIGWPTALTPPQVATEWQEAGLPMASLSLPGLTLDPRGTAALPRAAFELSAQYWYGLPYLDQVHALSQMPPSDEEDEPALARPRSERRPLERENLDAWWQDLVSRQFLARTEAAECLARRGDTALQIDALIEPYAWPVLVEFTQVYPGKLTLTDASNGTALPLTREAALRGLHGAFSLAGGDLRLASVDPLVEADFRIVAGSMVSAQQADGSLRDQRGLKRSASTVITRDGHEIHVDTPLERDAVEYVQRTLLRPLELTGGDDTWSFLMAGVALKDGEVFTRAASQSDFADDANDPGARGAAHSFLAGHTWWLRTSSGAPLRLCGLDVFPLALERIGFAADGTVELELLARLQLPVPLNSADGGARPLEQTQRSNAVHLLFAGRYDGSPLALTGVAAAPASQIDEQDQADDRKGEWPLTADEAGPIVTWDSIWFDAGKLTVSDARLAFGLFGCNWDVVLDKLVFAKGQNTPLAGTVDHVVAGMTVQGVAGTLAVAADRGKHQVELRLAFAWGEDVRLQVAMSRAILGATRLAPQATWQSAGGSLPLRCDAEFTPGLGFQSVLSFDGAAPPDLQLLPGMAFATAALLKAHVSGFAAAAFVAGAPREFNGHVIPELGLSAAAAELIAPAAWGSSLQDAALGARASASAVFGSSAGDLFANFSAQWQAGKWSTSLLLNGWLEIKNLVSWPESLVSAPEGGDLLLPQTKTLYFTDDSDDLPADHAAIFAEVIAQLRTNRHSLRFEGHASDTGDAAHNLGLSRRRAEKVHRAFTNYVNSHVPPGDRQWLLGRVDNQPFWFGENRLAVLAYDDEARRLNRRVTLMLRRLSVRIPTAAESLNHDRHTIRILFNQQALDGNSLSAGPKDQGILATVDDPSWSFVAVVQHELTRIRDIEETRALVQSRRRWTVAQEVRLIPAATLATRLKALSVTKQVDPFAGDGNVGDRFQWILRKTWLTTAHGGDAISALAPGLVVDASAPLWLRTPLASEAPLTPADASVIQVLPGGTQQVSLTNPADFGTARQGSRPWLFLSLPFVGRLLAPGLEHAPDPKLARDPVESILADHATTPPAVLALACRESARPLWTYLRDVDDAEDRRFERLTEGVLEESFFRYLHPAPESGGDTGSFTPAMVVKATNTSNQAVRPAALAAAFRTERTDFPPGTDVSRTNYAGRATPAAAPVTDSRLWFAQQAGVRFDATPPLPREHSPVWVENTPQSFVFPAFVLRELWSDVSLATFVAATALPVASSVVAVHNLPVTVAVSPCTALAFSSIAPGQATRLVTFGEVVAITTDKPERPAVSTILSTVWIKPKSTLNEDAKRWASEAASQLAPESAVVIVRLRSTVELDRPEHIVTRFEYLLATPSRFAPAEPPGRRLRSTHTRLHFAEAQAADETLPAAPRRFELAPPLTTTVQPLWSTTLASEISTGPSSLSGLRLGFRTLEPNGPAVVGPITEQDKDPVILWWQALWHQVAFDADRKLLPKGFRAPARRGYAAAPVQLKAPDRAAVRPFASGVGDPWQPVLPAAVDCILIGARPGAPFSIRPLAMTQHESASELASSASVPVQHRFPRPVPLPANDADKPGHAQQPWASFVFPAANHLERPDTFADIAAFDLPGGSQRLVVRLEAVVQERVIAGGQVLEIAHRGGIVLANHKTLAFRLYFDGNDDLFPGQGTSHVSLTDGVARFELKRRADSGEAAKLWEPATPEARAELAQWINRKRHGSIVDLEVAVAPTRTTKVKGYSQVLRLPVQVCDPLLLRASLERRLIHFEDPAYNRSLSSVPAQKLGELLVPITGPRVQRPVMLAVDRREYNPSSRLIGVFVDPHDASPFEGYLQIRLVTSESQEPKPLALPSGLSVPYEGGKAFEVELGELKDPSSGAAVTLTSGDSLLIQVWSSMNAGPMVEVAVKIVTRSVSPPPDHAYALLAASGGGDGDVHVRCVRFAWSPAPARIELLDPDDLVRSAVRRRAVFRWLDVVVPHKPDNIRHAIQKITPSGSTHWPAG